MADAIQASSFPAFVKPPDDKVFAARVYPAAADLEAATQGLDGTTPVLLSEPVKFEVEYRAFVENRRLAALSAYVRDGKIASGWHELPGERVGAEDFLSRLLATQTIEMPPALVIDIGRLPSMQWAVVEANPAWASGICGCDPVCILPVLAAASVARGTHSRWARDAFWVHRSEHRRDA